MNGLSDDLRVKLIDAAENVGIYMGGAYVEVEAGVRKVDGWSITAAGEASGQWLEPLVARLQAEALRAAADEIQAMHPGEVKNSVVFLRERADGITAGDVHRACDCVPELGPPHCHQCSASIGSPVTWDDCPFRRQNQTTPLDQETT